MWKELKRRYDLWSNGSYRYPLINDDYDQVSVYFMNYNPWTDTVEYMTGGIGGRFFYTSSSENFDKFYKEQKNAIQHSAHFGGRYQY